MNRAFPVLLLASGLLLAGPATAQEVDRRRGFSVRVTAPVDQDVVIGKALISAEVEIEREERLDRVEFHVDGELIFLDREPPFSTYHDFGAASKDHVVRVTAYHREGATATDFVITRKISLSYHVDVQRVILHATVLGENDYPVEDLDKTDFRILEDGEERPIIDFYVEERPLAVAIVLDTSGSMKDRMEETQKAAASFIDFLGTEDRGMVVDFDEQVYLLQDLTGEHEPLKEAINSTHALGGTALFDALHACFGRLKRLEGRKAVILLSDGDDTESQFTKEKVLEEARTSDVIIYPIGLGGTFTGLSKGVLKDLAEETGGRAFFPGKAKELPGVYRQIALELRHQYYLTYSSDNEIFDGRWIKIRLEPDNRSHKVITRRGYYAVRN